MTTQIPNNYESPWGGLHEEMSGVLQEEFGEWVVHYPCDRGVDVNAGGREVGDQYRVFGIFDDRYDEVLGGLENGVGSSDPWLSVRVGDFEVLPRGDDRFLVRGFEYEVTDVQPDGQGRYRIKLVKLEL